MTEDDNDPEAPPTTRNAIDGKPGSDGVGVDRIGSLTGTPRLLGSNTSMFLPSYFYKSSYR